jgi:hypothetical protein
LSNAGNVVEVQAEVDETHQQPNKEGENHGKFHDRSPTFR